MTSPDIDENYVELISSVSYANDVFRVTLARKQGDTDILPVARLLIPENQLLAIVKTLNNAAAEIGEKVRENMEGAQVGGGQEDAAQVGDPGDGTVDDPGDGTGGDSAIASSSDAPEKFSLWNVKTWSPFKKT